MASLPSFDINLDSDDFTNLCRDNWHFDTSDNTDGSESPLEYGITRAHWIRNVPIDELRKAKTHSSIVIYLNDPYLANDSINGQIAINGIQRRTERYHALPTQCFKCRKYGHISALCKNDSRCGLCAGNHLTRDCKCTDPTPCANTAHCTHVGVKCSACGGTHRDTDPSCSARK